MMAMSAPRPLYRLPEVLKSERIIVICEGEKAVDAAVSLGYTATTSVGGCNAVKQTDWSPLAGRECIILPDNDPPGEKFAGRVVEQLKSLDPKPTIIKIVYLPDLPPKGDIVEFIEANRIETACDDGGGGSDKDEEGNAEALQPVRQTIDQLILQTDPLELDDLEDNEEVAENECKSNSEGEENSDLAFRPFPVEVFPKPIRIYIESAAASIGCDPSLVAAPLLAAFSSAIGRTRRIQLKQSWREPAVLWTVIVGESGTSKSPALDAALEFVRRRESRFMKENEEARKEYERTLAAFEHQLATSKRGNGRNDSGGMTNTKTLFDRPDEPLAKRFLIDNVTIEGLIALAAPNPRGLFMARDELSTWIGGFDRYAKNGGGEAPIWIQTFGCRSITVDRKTSGTIYCEAPTISITGGIQPDTLRRMLGREHRENGLAARIFFAWPPRKVRRWTDTEIDSHARKQVGRIFESLFSLEANTDKTGQLQPIDLTLTKDGRKTWIAFFNDHGQEAEKLVGEMNRVWSKLEGGAARLALIIHELRVAADDTTLQNPKAVDAVSIRAGVQMARWFGHESQRIYTMLDESEADRQQRTLLETIQRKQAEGMRITPRLLMRSFNSIRTAASAKQALDELEEAGWGEWVFDPPKPTGGRPSLSFRLFDSNQFTSTSNNTSDHAS